MVSHIDNIWTLKILKGFFFCLKKVSKYILANIFKTFNLTKLDEVVLASVKTIILFYFIYNKVNVANDATWIMKCDLDFVCVCVRAMIIHEQ